MRTPRIRLFGANFFELLDEEKKEKAIRQVVDVLEAVGRRQHDGSFGVNYIRLRFIARRPL